MWTTPLLGWRLSPACWSPRATRWLCFPSRISPPLGTLPASARPGTPFWSLGGTSILWWPTIPPPSAGEAMTPIPPGTGRGSVPTGPAPSTPGSARRLTRRFPWSSADWRPACGGLPITITGTTQCAPPSWWKAEPISSPLAWGNGLWRKSPAAWLPGRRSAPFGTSGGPLQSHRPGASGGRLLRQLRQGPSG